MRNGDQRRMSVPLCAALLRLRFRALSTVASLMKRVGGHTRCLSRPLCQLALSRAPLLHTRAAALQQPAPVTDTLASA
jgi:hypothetical protein